MDLKVLLLAYFAVISNLCGLSLAQRHQSDPNESDVESPPQSVLPAPTIPPSPVPTSSPSGAARTERNPPPIPSDGIDFPKGIAIASGGLAVLVAVALVNRRRLGKETEEKEINLGTQPDLGEETSELPSV